MSSQGEQRGSVIKMLWLVNEKRTGLSKESNRYRTHGKEALTAFQIDEAIPI